MFIDCHSSRERHTVVNVQRKRLSGFFARHRGKFPIADVLGWLTDPGCSLLKRSNSDKFRATPSGLSERCFQRVLLATFSIRPLHATTEALSPPFPHFDPFGTEFCEPGRIS